MVLKSRVPAPDWSANENPHREAKCRKHPLPTKNDPNADNDPWFFDEEEAAHVCNGTYDGRVCPMREVCLYGALVNNEQAGVWGGFLTVQRRWIRKQREAEDDNERIYRDDWEYSEQWRDRVPDLEYFDELERLADAEEDSDEEEE